MVFFDSETEEICKELGYDLILPAASLREHLDSKIVTTRLGNEAGAPSVPNVLTRSSDWDGPAGGRRKGRSRRRTRGADAVRRLRQDHLLHLRRRPTGRSTAPTSSARRSR